MKMKFVKKSTSLGAYIGLPTVASSWTVREDHIKLKNDTSTDQ